MDNAKRYIRLGRALIVRLFLRRSPDRDGYTAIERCREARVVGAVIGIDVEDFYQNGKCWWFRLNEQGGKFHEIPVHHNAEAYLDEYLRAAATGWAGKSPLFCAAPGE